MAAVPYPLRFFGVLESEWVATNLHADSSYTEADPKPGTMATGEPQARLIPQILQAQSQDATIGVLTSGNPYVGEGAAQVGYFLEGETFDDIRGWEPPIRVTDWRMPATDILSETADAVYFPLSGRVACCWTGLFAVWNPHTRAWENAQTVDPDTGSGTFPIGALAVVPGTERLLLITDDNVFLTDDYGATWLHVNAERGLRSVTTDATLPAYTGKMRAAFDGAGGLLVAAWDDNDSSVDFYASSDLGATWVEVTSSILFVDFDLCVGKDGGVYVVTINLSDNLLLVRRLGGAFDNITVIAGVEPDVGGTFSGCWIACDHAGVLWVYANNEADPEIVHTFYSTDSGGTWIEAGRLSYLGDADNFPGQWRVVPSADGALCAATAVSAGALADGAHAGFVQLGGWAGPIFDLGRTSIASAVIVSHYLGQPRISYADENSYDAPLHWIATAAPEDLTGTGLSNAGAAPTTHSSALGFAPEPLGYVRIGVNGNASAGSYSAALNAGQVTAGAVEVLVRVVDDGGSDAAIYVGMNLDAAGTDRRAWKVYIQENGYRVWDDEANAFLGAKVLVDFVEPTWLRIFFGSGILSTNNTTVSWRHDGETAWTTDDWGAISVGGTGTLSGGTFFFGKEAVMDATADYYFANAVAGGPVVKPRTGIDSYGAIADEVGRAVLPDLANADTERVSYLRLRGGPGIIGEEYAHDIAPGYPVEALFPTREPSPSRRWRSTAKGVAQDFVVDLAFDTLPAGCVSLALIVRDCNVRHIELGSKEDGGGAYTTVGTLDLSTGFVNLSFTRQGRRITPAGVTIGARYIQGNELAGCRVILDTGGTPTPRTIRSNTAGFFNAAAGPQATLLLEDPDAGDATTGTLTIVWRSGVMPIHTTGGSTVGRRYWRARIPSTELAVESFYEVGTIALVGLVAPGKQWSANYSSELTPNVRSDTDSYGTERRQQLGPSRRRVQLSFDHGMKMDRIRGKTDADHLTTGAAAIVARDDVAWQLHGLIDQAQGGALPCLLLSVDPGTGVTLTDRTLWLWGYLDGSLQVQNASGDENVDEFYRTAISISEVV